MAKCDDRPGSSDVRERVLRNLRRVLVPGLMGLGACKGSGGDVVCDPLPPPPPPTDTAPPDSTYAQPPPEDAAVIVDPDAGTDERPKQDAGSPEPPEPPVVCDPLPPPPRKP